MLFRSFVTPSHHSRCTLSEPVDLYQYCIIVAVLYISWFIPISMPSIIMATTSATSMWVLNCSRWQLLSTNVTNHHFQYLQDHFFFHADSLWDTKHSHSPFAFWSLSISDGIPSITVVLGSHDGNNFVTPSHHSRCTLSEPVHPPHDGIDHLGTNTVPVSHHGRSTILEPVHPHRDAVD